MTWLLNHQRAFADDFLDSYVCWREACEDVRSAYQQWMNSKRRQRGLAFAAYRAALDREEYASRVYSERALKIRGAR